MAQSILVTGSSSGFGKLIVQTLATAGHHVFASMRDVDGRNSQNAQTLRDWGKAQGRRLDVVEMDVTDDASVKRAVSGIVESTGRIDAVVNNAGVMNIGVNEAFTLENMQQIYDVNVFGPFRVNKAALPQMRKQKSGLLIHITSIAGRRIFPFIGIYASSKFALEGLAESFSYDLRLLGIDSVIIEPGAYPTELGNNVVQPGDAEVLDGYGVVKPYMEGLGKVFESIFSGENIPDPQDVADAVLQLLELPAGKRPLRTVVDSISPEATEEINEVTEKIQEKALKNMGFEALLPVSRTAKL